jgi:hypothetical protein
VEASNERAHVVGGGSHQCTLRMVSWMSRRMAARIELELAACQAFYGGVEMKERGKKACVEEKHREEDKVTLGPTHRCQMSLVPNAQCAMRLRDRMLWDAWRA